MTRLRLAAIVEGHGEVEAVPVLLRRFAVTAGWPEWTISVLAFRQPASKLMKAGELERTVELAARKLGGPGGIFVLLDCEDACPARLGPHLLARVRQARSDLPSAIVLAHREFEAWFLGAAASLGGFCNLPTPLAAHPAPESVRGCKEWLSDQMPQSVHYREIDDQPALTGAFDFATARAACPSFDKCHREVTKLLQAVAAITPGFSAAAR